MKFSIVVPAAMRSDEQEYITYDRDAFEDVIGKVVPINIPGRVERQGVLLDAVVSPDGDEVELTIETRDQ